MIEIIERAMTNYKTGEESGETESGRARSPASLASEPDQAIANVKKTITAAELSDDLGTDLKEALGQALKRELAELEQLDPDAPFNPSALGAPAQHMISIFEGHSL